MSIGSLCVSSSPHNMGFQELLILFNDNCHIFLNKFILILKDLMNSENIWSSLYKYGFV